MVSYSAPATIKHSVSLSQLTLLEKAEERQKQQQQEQQQLDVIKKDKELDSLDVTVHDANFKSSSSNNSMKSSFSPFSFLKFYNNSGPNLNPSSSIIDSYKKYGTLILNGCKSKGKTDGNENGDDIAKSRRMKLLGNLTLSYVTNDLNGLIRSIEAASLEEVLNNVDSSTSNLNMYIYGKDDLVTPEHVDLNHPDGGDKTTLPQPVRENSMIACRKTPSGINGPEALFGRFNISVSMTRSIGGRYGPRCCFALPDVYALDISFNQYVRCVLASDGLWDVVSLNSVSKILNKYHIPAEAAKALTKKAYKERDKKKLRLDDITVIVVDLFCPP
jgi:hypothetical protein